MSLIVILTEKPSAARNFAKALGGMTGTYCGESYEIVSARGHLYEYVEPAEQVDPMDRNYYKSWNVSNLPWDETAFHWKRQPAKDVKSLLHGLSQTLAKCDEVVIATDVDPSGEGELLAWEILDELRIRNKVFSRMYFMDESEKEIQKAFQNRKHLVGGMLGDGDYRKAETRAKWDMLSMQFTRIASSCVENGVVLRQGRLKSAMVQIVGDGLKAVAEYKKVPFYMNKFKDENGVIYTNPEEPRFLNKVQVPQMYHSSTVVTDSITRMHTTPPKLMDLATLSSRLSSKGYKAKSVLMTYQKMYEAGILSYPRTEDKVITPEQFNDLLPFVDKIATVVGVDSTVLTHRVPRSTHVKTGGAHGANRPGLNVPDSLASLTMYGDAGPLIYELLAKNYLAMLAEDYEYDQEKGHLVDYPKFVGSTAVPKVQGWKVVFDDDASDVVSDETNCVLGLGTKACPYIAEGVNPKPPTPTMKWLMKQLEKCDVGTGATRTSTYADVTNNNAKYPLLSENRGKISMTDYGNMSYILLKNTHIGDIKLTEHLQDQMRLISEGKLEQSVCLHEMQDLVRDDIETMLANKQILAKEVPSAVIKKTERKEKVTGIWKGKEVSFTRMWGSHTFTDDECQKLLNGETIELDMVSKDGNPYRISGKLSNLEYKGCKYVGFKRLGFVNDCGSNCPASWCGHKFTIDERSLLETGVAVFCQGFKSKKTGRSYDCKVRFDKKTGKIIPEFANEF